MLTGSAASVMKWNEHLKMENSSLKFAHFQIDLLSAVRFFKKADADICQNVEYLRQHFALS